jgi:hypothetical protein
LNLTNIIILSLSITAIHVAFAEGNVLSPVRVAIANILDKISLKASRYIQKPLWDCLPCMASVWTIVLTLTIQPFLILAVCGLNVIVEKFIEDDDTGGIVKELPTLWRK